MAEIDSILEHSETDINNALERLFEFIRIESVSTDPSYAPECTKAADWLVDTLKDIGFDASRRETSGHPMVVAHYDGDGPHLLFYGHYDVQPVDPLELWDRPPFDPALRDTPDGKVIHGRGASDDKGQAMTFVEACRAWKDVTGTLPCKITVLFEGEEECASPSLVPFLQENADELKADVALVCDTTMWDRETPSITTMVRGIVCSDFTITAANRDLHSGMYGGIGMNPIRVLTNILGQLHDENGRVTLPNFYDGVPIISDEILAQWKALNFDSDTYLTNVGLSAPAGEKTYSPLEQIWARPTCDINGISGGYTGDGFKTVLPATASAKVSFRLVGNQDPVAIDAAFKKFVKDKLPEDCTVSFAPIDVSKATMVETSDPKFQAAKVALSQEWETQAVFTGGGGSLPIVEHFKNILDMDAMLVGFALDSDQIHSPNEKYDLRSYTKGIRSWIRILDALT